MGDSFFLNGDLVKIIYRKISKLLNDDISNPLTIGFRSQIFEYHHINPWFTEAYIQKSLLVIAEGLRAFVLPESDSRFVQEAGNKRIAVILNPGAPFEGLGELILLALYGFNCSVKLPVDSRALFENLFIYLGDDAALMTNRITFENNRMPAHDAVLVYNSMENVTALNYITGKPNLLLSLKGMTVTMSGNETENELAELAADIGNYYGKSVFSVRSLRVPHGYDFKQLFNALEPYGVNALNHRYFNHYEYNKSLLLINSITHFDNGFLLFTPDVNQTGRTGVISYSEFASHQTGLVYNDSDNISVSGNLSVDNHGLITGRVPFSSRLFFNSGRIAGFISGINNAV